MYYWYETRIFYMTPIFVPTGFSTSKLIKNDILWSTNLCSIFYVIFCNIVRFLIWPLFYKHIIDVWVWLYLMVEMAYFLMIFGDVLVSIFPWGQTFSSLIFWVSKSGFEPYFTSILLMLTSPVILYGIKITKSDKKVMIFGCKKRVNWTDIKFLIICL